MPEGGRVLMDWAGRMEPTQGSLIRSGFRALPEVNYF